MVIVVCSVGNCSYVLIILIERNVYVEPPIVSADQLAPNRNRSRQRGFGCRLFIRRIMPSDLWLPPALSSLPTELCFISPGFVPSILTTEIVISPNGQYVIPCMNGLFSLGTVVEEMIDYRHREGTGTIVIYHDPSHSFSRADRKNFLVVPLTRI
jgi:hypothetical protein